MGDRKPSEKARENRARRHAERLGLVLRKSRARHLHVDDFGGYQVIDPNHTAIVCGEKYDLSLDDVERFLDGAEQALRAQAPKR
jgi:hypothetical protein